VSLPIDIENRKIIPHPVIEFDPPGMREKFLQIQKAGAF
jgi:hypothetical protein